MTRLSPGALQWLERGRRIDVGGHRLYVQHRAAEGGGQSLLVFLHGFPTSSYDWREVADLLSERPMLLLDFLGLGLSDKPPDHAYSLRWQADRVEALVRQAGAPSVSLVTHDIGTSVATELFARQLDGTLASRSTRRCCSTAASCSTGRGRPRGQRCCAAPAGATVARLNIEATFRAQLGRIFSRAHPLFAQEAHDQWTLLAHAGGQRLLHRTIHTWTSASG